MKVTWKLWVYLLIATLAIGAACYYCAWRLPPWRLQPSTCSFLLPVPWPLSLVGLNPKPRRFDPADPQTKDPETIMGLALIGPVSDKTAPLLFWNLFEADEWSRGEIHESTKHESAKWEWFGRLSKLAICLAEEAESKHRLEQFALYVQTRGKLIPPGEEWMEASLLSTSIPPVTRAELNRDKLEERFEKHIVDRAGQIDPTNAFYLYRRAYRLLCAITARKEETRSQSETSASKQCGTVYRLVDEENLVPSARRLDEILSPVGQKVKLNSFQAFAYRLGRKALMFRYARLGPQQATYLYSMVMVKIPDSAQRELMRRLCFLADRLAAEEKDELALRMYLHAYNIGEQLMIAEGSQTTFLDYLSGNACCNFVGTRLMEFWAERGNAENVIQIHEFSSDLSWQVQQASKVLGNITLDPLGHNDEVLIAYLRSAGVTWCFAFAGLAMFLLSLASAASYLVIGRSRNIGDAPLRISCGTLLLTFAIPVFLILWLAYLVPLQLDNLMSAGAILAWKFLLAAGWIIAVGLLARHAGGAWEGAHRLCTGWIWPLVVPISLVGSLVLSLQMDGAALAGPIATVWVLTGGLVIWFVIVVVIGWSARLTPADLAYRARTNKAFASIAMVAAAVALLTALATMPLTKHHQNAYYGLTGAEQGEEITVYLGDSWPESFDGLPAKVFTLKRPAPQTGTAK